MEEAADVVADDGDNASHTEDGGEGLTAVHHQRLDHAVVAERLVAVVPQQDLDDLFGDAQDPEGAQHRWHVQTRPLGLGERRDPVVHDEGAAELVATVDRLPDVVSVVPENVLAHNHGHEHREDRRPCHK